MCIKYKNAFILDMVRDREILTKNLIFRLSKTPLTILAKNHFPNIFGGDLEFLHKMHLSLKGCRIKQLPKSF